MQTSKRVPTTTRSWAQNLEPVPARRFLHENWTVWYPMATTRGRYLLEPSQVTSSEASLLLLACADPLDILHTASAMSQTAAPGSATASSSASSAASRCQQLHFHMHNGNPALLARSALLLTLAREIDPEKDDDLDLLWAVWYHISLTAPQLKRLEATAGHLAETVCNEVRPGGFLKVPRDADLAKLKEVWNVWRAPHGLPLANEVREQRAKFIEEFSQTEFLRGFKRGNHNPMPPDSPSDSPMSHLATVLESAAFIDSGKQTSRTVSRWILEELMGWFRHGLAPGLGSIEEVTGGDRRDRFANATLLEPKSWKWKAHVGTTPFHGYIPIPGIPAIYSAELPESMDGKQVLVIHPNFLTIGCREVLRESVKGLQKWSQRGALQVSLWGGDALGLCLYQLGGLQSMPLDRGPGEPEPSDGEKPLRFDVIDSADVGDHRGLLNVLLCTRPLLKRHPHARLYTQTQRWARVACTLEAYVRRALGEVDLRLLPSLLGLRLCTHLQLGTANTPLVGALRHFQWDYSFVRNRILEWAPACHMVEAINGAWSRIPPTPLTVLGYGTGVGKRGGGSREGRREGGTREAWRPLTSTFPAPCGIAQALQRLAAWACEGERRDLGADSEFHTLSSLTLVLLHLTLLPAVEASRLGSDIFRSFLAGMAQHKAFLAGWTAMWRITIGHMKAPSRRLWQSAFPSEAQTVAIYRGELGPVFRDFNSMYQSIHETPQLRLFLFEQPGPGLDHVQALRFIDASLRCVRKGTLRSPFHIIDNFSFDEASTALVFALPSDCALCSDRTLVAMAAADLTFALSLPVKLAAFKKEDLPRPSMRFADLPPSSGPSARGARPGAVEVAVVSEFADCFRAAVRIPVKNRDAVALYLHRSKGGNGGEGGSEMIVSLGRQEATMGFSWPVTQDKINVQVSRKEGLVLCFIPKAPQWALSHLAFPFSQKVRVGALPMADSVFTKASLQHVGRGVYTLPEVIIMRRRQWEAQGCAVEPIPKQHHFWSARAFLVNLCDRYEGGRRCYLIKKSMATRDCETEMTVVVGSMRRTPEMRPLLEVVWRDHQRSKEMVTAGLVTKDEVEQSYLQQMSGGNGSGCEHGVFEPESLRVGEHVLPDIRDLLSENSARTKPSDWQKSNLLTLDWSPAFLTPLFPDEVLCWGQVNEVPTLSETWGLPMGYDDLKRLQHEEDRLERTITGPRAPSWVAPSERATAARNRGDSERYEWAIMDGTVDLPPHIGDEGEEDKGGGKANKPKGTAEGRESQSQGSQPQPSSTNATKAHTSKGQSSDSRPDTAPTDKKTKRTLGPCGKCGATAGPDGEKLKKCNRCRSVPYCGPVCQKAHWPEHKLHCKPQPKDKA